MAIVICFTGPAFLLLMTVLGALIWGDRHTNQPRSMLTLSTVAAFVWLYWRAGALVESLKWTAAYAGLQLGYGLVVQRAIGIAKELASGDRQLAAWSLILGLLWTIAPVVPILFLRKRLFAKNRHNQGAGSASEE